jgi:NitT/TauT family transport system permease protein
MNAIAVRSQRQLDWLASGDRLLVLIVLLVVWQVLFVIAGSTALSSPVQTAITIVQLLGAGDFWQDVWASGLPYLISVAIEIVAGILLGVFFGMNRLAGDVSEPFVLGLYSVPKIVFYPIILMFCGIGITAEVVFAVIHGILPIMLYTMTSVRTIKPVYRKTARVMRLNWWQSFTGIAVPAAFPEIFTGIRVGVAVTLLGVLLCEMFGSKNGLGFRLVSAMGGSRIDEVMAVAILLIAFAVALNVVLLAVERRLRHQG